MPKISNRGESRNVVCVHGAGGGGWEWAIWARVLAARGYGVLAPDLRAAAGGLATTRHADYRDQVVDWCRAVLPPIVLVGASLGASLALAAADQAGACALVLVNPLTPRAIAPAQSRKAWPATIPWRRERSLARTRRAMRDADAAACLYAFRRWRDESGAVLAEAVEVVPPAPRCPVLVLAGGRDGDVPAAASRALATHLGADFERIAEAGHIGPLLGLSAAAAAERAAGWLEARGSGNGPSPPDVGGEPI